MSALQEGRHRNVSSDAGGPSSDIAVSLTSCGVVQLVIKIPTYHAAIRTLSHGAAKYLGIIHDKARAKLDQFAERSFAKGGKRMAGSQTSAADTFSS